MPDPKLNCYRYTCEVTLSQECGGCDLFKPEPDGPAPEPSRPRRGSKPPEPAAGTYSRCIHCGEKISVTGGGRRRWVHWDDGKPRENCRTALGRPAKATPDPLFPWMK